MIGGDARHTECNAANGGMMVDHELDELKREFLAEAEEKVREMQTALDGGNALDRIAYLAHQLKGSGGSYGYQSISADAAEIEKAVEAGGNGTSLDVVRKHVKALQAEIDRAAKELGAPA
jgi:HPt (histidine-containing phosphotransfer) domain-containing protein